MESKNLPILDPTSDPRQGKLSGTVITALSRSPSFAPSLQHPTVTLIEKMDSEAKRKSQSNNGFEMAKKTVNTKRMEEPSVVATANKYLPLNSISTEPRSAIETVNQPAPQTTSQTTPTKIPQVPPIVIPGTHSTTFITEFMTSLNITNYFLCRTRKDLRIILVSANDRTLLLRGLTENNIKYHTFAVRGDEQRPQRFILKNLDLQEDIENVPGGESTSLSDGNGTPSTENLTDRSLDKNRGEKKVERNESNVTAISEQPVDQENIKSSVKKVPPDSASSTEDSEEEEDYRHLEGFTRSAAGIEKLGGNIVFNRSVVVIKLVYTTFHTIAHRWGRGFTIISIRHLPLL
ncbi:unnamed protein product [Nezara viridula]|uniref:Uncharacterized protein n=1 Tax=Nezara viridula TaxID=85310 RepID=A0A9P0H3E9_NEZVI|nr:unnamed protein product [Nezara viridula]